MVYSAILKSWQKSVKSSIKLGINETKFDINLSSYLVVFEDYFFLSTD